ncbi:MAG TPA: TonB-dependent receptor, partial [Pyrinomonadaceae bacterium]|nr:TonB-dependent receptor [Pyrinomonadaceae bacterium]
TLTGTSISLIGSGVFDRSLRTDDYAAFIQDDFKLSERLTLNLGLRFDLFTFPRDARGRVVNFIPEQYRTGGPPNGFVQAAGGALDGVPTVGAALVEADKNNFSPRVGFAYRLTDSGRVGVRGGYGIYYDRPSTRLVNTQLLNYPYFALGFGLVAPVGSPVFRPLSNPFVNLPPPGQFPVAATIPSPLSPLAPVVGLPIVGLFVDQDMRTPYVQQYNLNVQYEFVKDWLLEVGYVGAKGTKLLQVATLNQQTYNPATGRFNPPPFPFLSTNRNVAGGIQQVRADGNSKYNSLQISVTKRLSRRLQLLSAYTLGKSVDTHSGTGFSDINTVPGDQFDLSTNKGPSDFDRRHRFITSFVYDLPKLNTASALVRALFNNYQINGIVTLQTGTPFSIVESNGTSVIQRANFAQGFSGRVETGNTDPAGFFFNPAAFTRSTLFLTGTTRNPNFDPAAPYGNTARNFLYGPGQKNVDFAIVKFLPLREGRRGEFRTEFFNIFNFANFANPVNNVLSPLFGKSISTSSGPRVIQFAFKLNF